jgi:hypothetical protein
MDILTAENYRQIDEQLERSLSRRPLEGDFRGFLFGSQRRGGCLQGLGPSAAALEGLLLTGELASSPLAACRW